jgi:hypothetical protein
VNLGKSNSDSYHDPVLSPVALGLSGRGPDDGDCIESTESASHHRRLQKNSVAEATVETT